MVSQREADREKSRLKKQQETELQLREMQQKLDIVMNSGAIDGAQRLMASAPRYQPPAQRKKGEGRHHTQQNTTIEDEPSWRKFE